jgi:hypothetical protein
MTKTLPLTLLFGALASADAQNPMNLRTIDAATMEPIRIYRAPIR